MSEDVKTPGEIREHSLTQLQAILKQLEKVQNYPTEPAEIENLKMRIHIHGILLRHYASF